MKLIKQCKDTEYTGPRNFSIVEKALPKLHKHDILVIRPAQSESCHSDHPHRSKSKPQEYAVPTSILRTMASSEQK